MTGLPPNNKTLQGALTRFFPRRYAADVAALAVLPDLPNPAGAVSVMQNLQHQLRSLVQQKVLLEMDMRDAQVAVPGRHTVVNTQEDSAPPAEKEENRAAWATNHESSPSGWVEPVGTEPEIGSTVGNMQHSALDSQTATKAAMCAPACSGESAVADVIDRLPRPSGDGELYDLRGAVLWYDSVTCDECALFGWQ